MQKSCQYCGQMHPVGYRCPKQPIPKRQEETKASRFRSSWAWQRKREEIQQRDLHLCQICLRGLYDTIARQYNYKDVQVHHIIPIVKAWGKRLDAGNLISLCKYHHEMAEAGRIPAEVLFRMAQEQIAGVMVPPGVTRRSG